MQDPIAKAAFEFKGSPIEGHLKKKRNYITIDDVARYLSDMGIDSADADNEDFFEAVLDTITDNGGRIVDDEGFDLSDYRKSFPNIDDAGLNKLAMIEYEGDDDDETRDKVRMAYFDLLNKSRPWDTPSEGNEEEDDGDEDDDIWEELMEKDEEPSTPEIDDTGHTDDAKSQKEKSKKPYMGKAPWEEKSKGSFKDPITGEDYKVESDERVKDKKETKADEPIKPEVASDEKCKENKKPCAEEDSTRFSDESLKNIIGVLADRIL